MATENKTEQEGVNRVKLSIKQIKEDLTNGFDRKAIAKKYGLNFAAIKTVFQHPKLKGLKVKKAPNVDLEDDDDDAPVYVAPVPKASRAKTAKTATATAENSASNPAAPIEEVKATEGVW